LLDDRDPNLCDFSLADRMIIIPRFLHEARDALMFREFPSNAN